jgi:hypothetical protein
MDSRSTYLATATIALELLRDPAVATSWDRPSALSEWRVSGLAGHLARAVTTVEQYLVDEAPAGQRVTAGGYYALVIDTEDLSSDLHRTIRQRGDEMADEGHTALADRVSSSLHRLRERLPTQPLQRTVTVFAGTAMELDQYLATRLVELVVHCDDLALSVGIATPELPADAYRLVTEALIDTARQRHGDLAVVRALARRERDGIEALRVF